MSRAPDDLADTTTVRDDLISLEPPPLLDGALTDDDAYFAQCDELAAALAPSDLDGIDPGVLAEAAAEEAAGGGGAATSGGGGALAIMQRHVATTCDGFADTFLSRGSSVSELQVNLVSCDNTLREVQGSLRKYLKRIDAVARDIGVLQAKASDTAAVLTNTIAVQSAVDATVTALLVPPDCVRVILGASETEIGQQFIHEVKRFGAVLANRRRGIVTIVARQPQVPASSGDGGPGAAPPPPAQQPQQLDLRQLPAYRDSGALCRKLAGVACAKIHAFLIAKINATLGKTRTNVAVQQQNVLRDFRSLVLFLRNAGPTAYDDPVNNPAVVLYEDLRRHYSSLVAGIYSVNLRDYLIQCNALEIDWRSASAAAGGAGAAASAAAQSRALSGLASGLFGTSKHTAAVQPTLTDRSAGVSGEDFALGARGRILDNVSAMPVVPVVARRAQAKHSYEETFRSAMVLLCDGVTSEFLFSFDFFGGDATVYVDVFKPTIHLVVDYVADVVLRDSGIAAPAATAGSNGSGGSGSPGGEEQLHHKSAFERLQKAAAINTDYCGLLIMIRLVHLFRVKMHARRLDCLDGFFDSLLLLLWPAFKVAFDRQLSSLRTATPATALPLLALHRGDVERLTAVHPVADRYAHLSLALMLLSRGIHVDDVEHGVPAALSLTRNGGGSAAAASSTSGDTAEESRHRFAVLASNLGYLRIEFERLMQGTSDALVSAVAKLQSVPLTVAQHVVIVNNYYHVLSVWSDKDHHHHHSYDDEHHHLSQHQGDDNSSDGGSTPLRPPRGSSGRDLTSASPYQGGVGRASSTGGSGEDLHTLATSKSSAASLLAGLGGGVGDGTLRLARRLVHAAPDFQHLKAAYAKAAAELASEALRRSFAPFLDFVEKSVRVIAAAKAQQQQSQPTTAAPRSAAAVSSSSTSGGSGGGAAAAGALPLEPAFVAEVERVGKAFAASLRVDLDAFVACVRRFVCDAANATAVTKLGLSELVVANTRFHGVAAAALAPAGQAALRAAVVTSQQLLAAMKRSTGA